MHVWKYGFIVAISIVLSTTAQASGGGSAPPSPYLAFEPAFVVNLQEGKRLRFMQVKLQAKTSLDPLQQARITQHMPALRHELIMLFSRQDIEAVRTPEGKAAMMKEATEKVKTVMKEQAGDEVIESLYITGLVIQ